MVLKHQINEAFLSAKFAFLDNETFVTKSWTKYGAKMLKLWDVRKVKEDLTSKGEVSIYKLIFLKLLQLHLLIENLNYYIVLEKVKLVFIYLIIMREHLKKELIFLLLNLLFALSYLIEKA